MTNLFCLSESLGPQLPYWDVTEHVNPLAKQTFDATDAKLVQAALAHSAAYAKLVVRFEGVLERYVRRLLGQHQNATSDVLQEAFIKAYVNLNDFDQSRPFSPWIYRIAHNEAINYLRKRKVEPHTINGEDGQIILEKIADGADTAYHVLSREREQKLKQALAVLDPRYRDILVLRYLEDKSYSEIADILHLPSGTVAIHLKRGLKKLKATMLHDGDLL